MSLKDLRSLMVKVFCVTVTIIVVANLILDTFLPNYLGRGSQAGDTGAAVLMSLIGAVSFVVFYSPKELSRKQMFIRVVIHLILTTPVIWYLYWKWDWFPMETLGGRVVAVVGCVLSYVSIFGGIFLKELSEANKMNLALKKKKQEHVAG